MLRSIFYSCLIVIFGVNFILPAASALAITDTSAQKTAAQEVEDFEILSALNNDELYQSAYSFGLDFLTAYPKSDSLWHALYLLTTNPQLDARLNQYFNQTIYPNLDVAPIFNPEQLYYLILILFYFDKSEIAQEYQTKFFSDYPSHPKAANLKFKIIKLLFNNRKWQLAQQELNNVDEFNFSESEKKELAYIETFLGLKLANPKIRPKKIKALINNEHLTASMKINILAELTQNLEIDDIQEASSAANSYLYQAKKLATNPKELLKIDLAYASLIFNRYSLAKPIQKNAEIDAAIAIFSANINHQEPFDLEESFLARGWLYYITGQNTKAKADWEKQKVINKATAANTALLLANIYQDQKKWRDANFILQNATKETSDEKEIARLRLQKMRNYLAGSQCQYQNSEALKTDWPKFPDWQNEAYALWGECLYKLKKFKAALDVFQKIALTSPDFKFIFRIYYDSLLQTKNFKAARKLVAKAVKLNNFAQPALTQAGSLLIDKKMWSLANQLYEDYLDIPRSKAEFASWQLLKAEALWNTKKTKEAEKILSNLAQTTIDNDYPPNITRQAISKWLQLYQATPAKQAAIYDSLLSYRLPQDLKTKLALDAGRLWYDKLKKPQVARKHWSLLLESNNLDQKLSAVSLITETYIYENAIDKAEEFLGKNIVQAPPKSPLYETLWLRLAQIYHSQKKWGLATSAYQKVIAKKPKSKEAQEAKDALTQIKKSQK